VYLEVILGHITDQYRFLDTFSVPACLNGTVTSWFSGVEPFVVEYPQRTHVSYLEAFPINLSSLFGFPSTLDLDRIEVHEQTVLVHLHATSLTATCPQCGTAGSRVHSRYERTIADLAFGERSLVLTLLVRKWICPEALCVNANFILAKITQLSWWEYFLCFSL
jgi:zinc-finger of transposase IS204/IS1001/IS1096/IS1165